MSDYTQDATDSSFEQIVLQSNRPVLVDFWAEWCQPCRTLAPIVEAVARQYAGAADVFKLNVDDSPSIAQRYAIQGIPTLILFKDGKEQERIVGIATKEAIFRMIDSHMSASPDARKVG